MNNLHPNIKQFKAKMEQSQILPADARAFDKWRNNAKKCEPGSETKVAADQLWAEFQEKGGEEAFKFRPQPQQVHRPGSGSGGANAHRLNSRGQGGVRPQTRADTNNAGAASAACLGEPFHNPFTFIPFPPANWFEGPRKRCKPTPLTMDEVEKDRFTGIVEIDLETCSPLLTCHPDPVDPKVDHKTYRALAMGPDVIVPATGVRGSLRNLMSIIAGGTLGYIDEGSWLVQGRDLPLGPKGKNSPPETPVQCCLAEVSVPGNATRPGKIKLGETRLIRLEALEKVAKKSRVQLSRPKPDARPKYIWMNDSQNSLSERFSADHPWKLKLSGRPINTRGKREGLFKADGREITLPESFWADYQGRYRHGDHPELRQGDLVWLEPAAPHLTEIREIADIASIQWARWGRAGQNLLDLFQETHKHMLPDSHNPDGLVDEVTNLFGQVPFKKNNGAAGPFAARVRPENLVFHDAAEKGLLRAVTLAPLAPPHPGCAAFYRANNDPDSVVNRGPLRGFKSYRVSSDRGDQSPWLFSTQGVYDEHGNLKPSQQKVNKTCDLLKEGQKGRLRLACRSLSQRELALILLACSVDWRMGGGKPLGLGVCRPLDVRIVNESGHEVCRMMRDDDAPATLPEPYAGQISDLKERCALWHAVMQPVERMRYPRAVSSNRNRIQRGGHVWFQRHANPKKGSGPETRGLEVCWADREMQDQTGGPNRIKAQPLPSFNAQAPESDLLYGYDLYAGEGPEWRADARNHQTFHKKFEPFNPREHATGHERSGGFHGQNQDRRRDGRRDARRGH